MSIDDTADDNDSTIDFCGDNDLMEDTLEGNVGSGEVEVVELVSSDSCCFAAFEKHLEAEVCGDGYRDASGEAAPLPDTVLG